MALKNILSDTDHTTGRDNRYKHTVGIGKVTKIECDEKRANIRVLFPDKVDHEGTPLISKPIPVLQISAGKKRSYAIPRIGQNVAVVKLANSSCDYLAIGTFYTTKDPPPISDPKVDYVEWEGGHIEKHDANDDAEVFLTQDFKGGWNCTVKKDVNIKTTDGAKTNIDSDGDVSIKSANGNIDVKSPNGTVTIEQQNITLKGTVTIQGNIVHTGDMTTSGHHTDANGLHTGALRERDEKIAELEARLEKLEQLILKTR
jgi:phage baseplate assembly protein gpV